MKAGDIRVLLSKGLGWSFQVRIDVCCGLRETVLF